MDTYWVGSLLIAMSILLAVAGLFGARRIFDLEHLRETHEVGGALFSAAGTLYAVLLGLIVVDAMSKFAITKDLVQNEANNIANVYFLADCLTEEKCRSTRKLCIDYCREVINKEWKAMDQAKFSPEARQMALKMLNDIKDLEPKTQNQQALYPIIVQSVLNIWDYRSSRIRIAAQGVPEFEWLTLLAGGVITVFFTYFFGLERVKIQTTMVAMVTMLISLNLYLFILFGYPFSGDLAVNADAFKNDLEIFEGKAGQTTAVPVMRATGAASGSDPAGESAAHEN